MKRSEVDIKKSRKKVNEIRIKADTETEYQRELRTYPISKENIRLSKESRDKRYCHCHTGS